MIHPARRYSSLPLVILALVLVACAAHGATLVLGYGGSFTSSGVGVYPQDASANSERYFRCVVGLSTTETLNQLTISGVGGTIYQGNVIGNRLVPKPNGDWNDCSDGVVRDVIGGTTTYYIFTIGPYAGLDIFGALRPNVIGEAFGATGYDQNFTFYASVSSAGNDASPPPVTGTYRTNWDNADILEWFSGDAAGVDPLSVIDSPTPGIDNGSGSNTFRFRVQYKIPNVFNLNLLPRFGTPTSPPSTNGQWFRFADFDAGQDNAQPAGDRTGNDWWTYEPGYGSNWTQPLNQSNNYPRGDDFTDQIGYYGNNTVPEVALIIDGDRSRPRFMQREDRNDSNARDDNGIRYFYDLLPTDYMNLMDHVFLFPYAPPGPDPQDQAASFIVGRPVSNNYVGFQATYGAAYPNASAGTFVSAAGGHTYEFICTDDFSPPNGNSAWLQVGWPGNDEHNQYMQPRVGSGGIMDSYPPVGTAGYRRFRDDDGASGGYGYPYNSQDATQYPNVNPVLTAHPYFPRGCVTANATDASLTTNPPGARTNPFTGETGAGPSPAVRVTNDDTILPNYVNIRPDADTSTPPAPFRGGKWTSTSSYTLRINYWQSGDATHPLGLAPEFIRVMVRRNNDGAAPGSWRGYTMEKADPTDNNYVNGCVYQYITTPDQLPDGGGPGDYNYQFVASDGIRQTIFPNRPANYEYQGNVTDPGDIGVPPGNNDYYSFRVNQPPVLSAQSVTPVSATAGNDFVFSVNYTDPDGEMLNTAAQGDRPFEGSIYLDLFGNPQGDGRVVSVRNETTLNYSMSGGTGYTTNELAGYNLEVLTGTAAGRSYPIVSNTTSQIVVTGTILTDGVASSNRFRVSNWFNGTMLPADETDLNYADGKVYTFSSATHIVLGPGVHRYHFVFRDDWGSWLFPNDANLKVEGEPVRFPFTGEFEGPEVLPNTPPVLTDYRYTPMAPDPVPPAPRQADGTTATPFVFSVTYVDEENNPPSLIRLGIDPEPGVGGTLPDTPALVVNMVPDNPTDNVYTDGAIYETPQVKLAEGKYVLRAQASDGSGRYPVSQAGQPFLFAGEPSDDTDLRSTPDPSEQGPFVMANTPPTLTFPTTDAVYDPTANPPLYPGLDPNTGRVSTPFTYTVIYWDRDRFAGVAGNPPDYVRVVIDNVEQNMTKVDNTDNDYTDGVTYQFQVTGLVEGTPHRYWFIASDGLDRARLPIQGASPTYYNGPVVDEPPGPPQSLLAQDHANDNGANPTIPVSGIELRFSASQDDGGGAGDVTEYRIYRTETPGTYNDPPVKTVPATGAPTYGPLYDNTAVTGTPYYYVVRAWDGANESANSNQEGPVSAIDNIKPQPPSNVTVIDPGLGGTLAVSWNLSPDDGGGQNDVTEYHLYRAESANGFTTQLGTATKGETSYLDTTAVDGTDYWYLVRSFDGTNESDDPLDRSNVGGPEQSTDQQAPVIDNIFPADRALDVARDTNISFQVSDSGTGVDRNRLQTTVTVGGVVQTIGTPTITGTPARYTVVYNPPADFDYRAVVNVSVEAYDLGGKSATKAWRFTITGPPTYTISGSVLDNQSNPRVGVVVAAGELSATTDVAGNYIITGLVNGTYDVTPTLRGVAFTPKQILVAINDGSVSGVNFVWQPAFDITGRITNGGGAGMSGVTVTEGSQTAITDANGDYQLLDLPAGQYNVVPALARYVFTPPTQLVTLGPSATNVDFQGALQTFSIGGTVTDLDGQRVAGVGVTATSGASIATATTNAAGQYVINNLLPGQWTVTPNLAGYVFRPASQTVNVDTNLTTVDFVGVPIYTVNLPAGLTFLALPITPEDTRPTTVFGAIPAWRYDPTLPDYRAHNADPNLEIVQVRPGRGFWVRPNAATVLNVPGTPVNAAVNQTLQLLNGWNMAGNPYAGVLPWANVGVTAGGPVSNFAYIHSQAAGYQLVSDAPGLGALTSIPQNSAMWMKSTGTRSVLISPPATAAAARYESYTRAAGEFVIPIIAQANGAQDTTARAGVLNFAQAHPEVYVADNPPFMSGSVDVYFAGADGGALTCDIRGAATGNLTYSFTVKTDLKDVPVKVSLPDLSEVPREKAIILTDVTSGKRLWARTLSSYTYNSGEGGERPFRLEIVPNLGGGLSATVAPAAVKSGAVSVTYTLSRPASVGMTILNLAGRTIRTLARDKAAQPGINAEAWDLRSDSGSKVPPGRYLIRLEAAAEDGQRVSAVAPLMVQ